tara:strand:- start:1084 stop:2661 length:1578 start_codon:yes stop_codon:yes gene_type:complete
MAINPETQYPGKITPGSANYPYGSARNVTVPGDGTGTPWEAALLNDIFGFQQALLSAAGIVPSGTPDDTITSQYLVAALNLALTGDYLIDTGAANAYVLGSVGDNPLITVYKDGQQFRFIPTNTSTAASSIRVGALAIKTVEDSVAGTFIDGVEVEVRYQALGDKFIVVSSAGNKPFAIISDTAAIQALDSAKLPDEAVRLVTTVNEYGAFVLDKGDTTSEDNTATISTIVVDSAGGRWIKRSDALVTEPYLGLPVVTEFFRDKLITGFNWNQSFDNDAGSALTLMNDQDLGRLSTIEFSMEDLTVNDGTPIKGVDIVRALDLNKYRITCKASGGDVKMSIFAQTEARFSPTPLVLTTGQIATPMAGFLPTAQYFIRVKKGLGQGKIGLEYQYQNPKSKVRVRKMIWVIDLDDGLAVRDYDLLLPQCSSATMLGQFKMGDSTNLNWVVVAVTGPVEIVGTGINPTGTSMQEVYHETRLNAEFPTTREWQSPVLSQKNTSGVRFFLTQINGGDTITATDIRIEGVL